jgi:hypothetical protein
MTERFGQTGEFLNGSIHEHDQGELTFGIAADARNGVVVVNFGKPVVWFGVRPREAREIAKALIAKANELDGGIGNG